MPFPLHLPPISESKSLTPQRKHRKLLKDGSGAEVWPESVEKIFVQGLQDYWSSPYATYPQSRGRSRWRNQFLVDYLQRHGVSRSKKQVASHIQVLRNMWKGEPEYQLVAGGEELADISPSAGSNIKLEDQHWSSGLIPMDFDDLDGYSSKSASPDFSPPGAQNQFLPSPDHLPTRQLDINLGAQYPSGTTTQSLVSSAPPYHTSFHSQTHDYSTFSSSYGHLQPIRGGLSIDINGSTSAYKHSNRVRALRLTADGMSPFIVRTDALIPPNLPYEPLQLKIRLSISTMQDVNCPPALHGFLATICFSHIWSTSAKCITKIFVSNSIVSEDVGVLQVSEISPGAVNAIIPESHLNRCRWLDPRSATTIIQEIIIDDVSLLFVIYELDRISGNPMPSAQFIGFLKYPTLRASSSGSMPTSFSNRHFASTTNDSSGSSIRAFSANSSTSAGLTSIVHPSSYPYNPLPNTYSHSTVMAMSNSDAIGSSGLCADSVHMHSHHGRHSSQSLAQALTPIRASSSPS